MSTGSDPGQRLLGQNRMITTSDGRRLRTMVRGHQATDLVVLEAGLGISALYWGAVHEVLAARTQVVAYDRAGRGGSDPDDEPRTLERLAGDLETVIDAFAHRRLVLVGHSWGGPIVRTVAALRLKRGQAVTGIVVVDQSDENSEMYFSRMTRRQFASQAAMMVPLARLGILRAVVRRTTTGLPEPLRGAAIEESWSTTRVTWSPSRNLIWLPRKRSRSSTDRCCVAPNPVYEPPRPQHHVRDCRPIRGSYGPPNRLARRFIVIRVTTARGEQAARTSTTSGE